MKLWINMKYNHKKKLKIKKNKRYYSFFIMKGFWTIVFIFIVISTTFWPICPSAFFRGLLNSGIFTESEQANPVDSIKDVVRSSAKVPEFNKHLKKAGRHIVQNVVEITIKMKIIVRKPLNDKNHQASSQKFSQLNWY